MDDMKDLTALKILNTVTFILMIVVNAIANILPLNGVTTGEVSKSYPNLFTPAKYTFSIWGLIYILLAGFILYQLGAFKGKQNSYREDIINDIGFTFAFSSLINAAWVVVWHYRLIPLSVIFMIALLISLISIVSKIKDENLTIKEKIFVKIPFSIYFGWITIAAIANIVVLLVSLGWNGWGIPEQTWMVIVLLLGLIISTAVTIKNKDAFYGLTIIWAYAGILVKHLSQDGFNGQYQAVIVTTIICLAVLALSVLFILTVNRKHPIKL